MKNPRFKAKISGRFNVPIASVVIIILLLSAMSYYIWHMVHKPLKFKDVVYTIEQGQSVHQVAEMLVDEKIINHTYSLRFLANWQHNAHKIHYGDYKFSAGINLIQFLDQISIGKGQVTLSITFIEGWNFSKLRTKLEHTTILKQTLKNLDNSEVMAKLGHPNEHPEGRFYPETYHYKKGATDLSILKQAYSLMQKNLTLAWHQRNKNLLLKNPYQALIMASIIEKETQKKEERSLISGVFHNRLRLGMRLQADPTVIYGLGESFDGNLIRAHLRTDTPYNTYMRSGIPPTPIAMPRLASLIAAVKPAPTKALYFVAKGAGKHHFSATLKQHNRAVNRYRR